MSIESHLVSLRTYLEGIASQNSEILAELKRINAQPKETQAASARKKQADGDAAATEQHAPDAFMAAVTQDTVSKPKAAAKSEGKAVSPAAVEKQLEAETGHDVVRTSSKPPTYVETDKPAPKSASKAKKSN